MSARAAFGCEHDDYLFPSTKRGRPLFGMAMDMLLRRLNLDVTVHGFRSSFREWCGELSTYSREVAEAALAHVVGDATERAYRRGDALEKRRELMEAWADFCEPAVG
jgi:integrase